MEEFTGLLVPIRYDCLPNFQTNMDYYGAVPSRWTDCDYFHFVTQSGLLNYVPQLPLIDEEYLEAAMVYFMALNATKEFNIIELGARWGTWTFRALAANRFVNFLYAYL
jgi:hypothetical protein